MEPPGATLEALLVTWDIPLRIFAHFYQVFVNNYAFLLKIHVETTKLQQNAAKIMNIAQEHRKGAYNCEGMLKTNQLASKVNPKGPKWAHLGPLLPTLGALLATLGHSFAHFYAFLKGVREQLGISAASSWKTLKKSAKLNESYEYCTKTQKKCVKVRNKPPQKNKRRHPK